MIPSAFCSFHLMSFTRISRGPSTSQKWIVKQHVRIPLNTPKAQHENHLPMYEPLPSPRQSHSQNNPKTLPGPRPALLGRVHLGPRRDQLLDHGERGLSEPPLCSAVSASGAEDATPTAGRLRLPSRNKAYGHGMFLRAVGQIFLGIGHR